VNFVSFAMEVKQEAAPLTVLRNFEKFEIQTDGINLCFIEKQGTETEDQSFVSLTPDGLSSIEHQSHLALIQEIDSGDVADSCTDLLAYNGDHSSADCDVHSINIHSSANLTKKVEDSANSLICKFRPCL